MGNCINLPLSQSPQKLRAKKKAAASESESESVEIINSSTEQSDDLLLHDFTLSTKRNLKVGEIQGAVPGVKELQKLLVSPKITYRDGMKVRKVKIVVTKEQLKLLLENAKLQNRRKLSNDTGSRRGCRKWRPSLCAISEAQDF